MNTRLCNNFLQSAAAGPERMRGLEAGRQQNHQRMVIILFLIALLLVRLAFGLITAAAGGTRTSAGQLVQQILRATQKPEATSRPNEKTSVSDKAT